MSIIIFIITGILVGTQLMTAFLAGTSGDWSLWAKLTVLAIALLALGAWLSPVDGARGAALAVLIGATVCVACFSLVIFVPGEAGAIFRFEQVRRSAFAFGFVNLAVVYATGLLLFFARRLAAS